MKKNMGKPDRIVRVIGALIILGLYFSGIVSGAVGMGLLIFAGVFALTSVVSFCPLYSLVGLNTCPLKEKK